MCFYMDIQHYISGRPSVSVLTYNMTSVDVHQFIYGRITFGRGRPPVTICNITSTDVHQFFITSTSYYMVVQHNIRGRPPVSLWMYNVWPWTYTSYYMVVQLNIRRCPPVSLWTYNVWPRTSINYYMDIQRLAGVVHQVLYGCTT